MKRVVHFEIYTDDPEAVRPFYQDVFGWTFKKFEGDPVEYWLVTTGDDKESGIHGYGAAGRDGGRPSTSHTFVWMNFELAWMSHLRYSFGAAGDL